MTISLPRTLRVTPGTTTVHLDVNGGEDVVIEIAVVDVDDNPVPLQSATAVIATAAGEIVHTWSAQAGNLDLLGDVDEPTIHSRVQLRCTAAQTWAWAQTWGDGEWQLATTDIFGGDKRPAEGEIRARPSLQGAP